MVNAVLQSNPCLHCAALCGSAEQWTALGCEALVWGPLEDRAGAGSSSVPEPAPHKAMGCCCCCALPLQELERDVPAVQGEAQPDGQILCHCQRWVVGSGSISKEGRKIAEPLEHRRGGREWGDRDLSPEVLGCLLAGLYDWGRRKGSCLCSHSVQ